MQFAGLDVLRCLAALAVVVYHGTLGMQPGFTSGVQRLLHNLSAGVDFFLLISGFLITYLLLAEKTQTGTISLYRFYVRRALRIFPLYYAIVGVAWWLHAAETPGIDFGSYALFVGNFSMIRHGWTVATLNPLWSLCIEEQFYLAIPVLLLLIPTRRLPWLFGGVVALSVIFRLYATLTLPANWMTIYCHTLSRCDVLALGGGLAWWHFTTPIRWQLPRWALGVGVAFLVLLLGVIDSTDYVSLTFALFKKYLYVLPMAGLFCFTLFNQSAAGPWLPAAIARALNYLGKISFGLYMYHSPLLFLLDLYPNIYFNSQWLRLLLILVLTGVVASLSYEGFEKQILRLKSRFEVVPTVRA